MLCQLNDHPILLNIRDDCIRTAGTKSSDNQHRLSERKIIVPVQHFYQVISQFLMLYWKINIYLVIKKRRIIMKKKWENHDKTKFGPSHGLNQGPLHYGPCMPTKSCLDLLKNICTYSNIIYSNDL